MTTISIKDKISSDLALRSTAQSFFDELELMSEKDIIIDFNNVISISRSFAHEYLINLRKSTKNISEVNMTDNIRKMFDVIKRTNARPKLVNLDMIKVTTLSNPVLN